MSNSRYPGWASQPGMRTHHLRIDTSDLTTSAATLPLDEGATVATAKKGSGASANEITITLTKPFARTPAVCVSGMNCATVWVKSVTTSVIVLETGVTYRVGSDACATGTTASIITATGHSALAGDRIIMTAGDETKQIREVSSVATNTITLDSALTGTPSAAETFDIVRVVQVVDQDLHVDIVGWDCQAES